MARDSSCSPVSPSPRSWIIWGPTTVDRVPAGAHRAERAVARRDSRRARSVADRLNLIRFVPAQGEAVRHVPVVSAGRVIRFGVVFFGVVLLGGARRGGRRRRKRRRSG